MSWNDKISNTAFRITTGDGKSYSPLWINGESSVDYNTKKHEFINVPGSMIDRKAPQAIKYPLVFYFQGEDNVDRSRDFLRSAADPRYWEVVHPFYGVIIGQPVSLQRIDDSFNVTRFVVDFWETLTEDYPNSNVSTRDIIAQKVDIVNQLGIANYVAGAKPTSGDISAIKENSRDVASKFDRMQTKATFVDYKNALALAIKTVDNIISAPGDVIFNNQRLLSLPGTYDLPVKRRLETIRLAYMELKRIIEGKNDKYYFESQAATAFGSLALASTTPIEGDYVTRNELGESSLLLSEIYSDYLSTLDGAQVDRYDTDNEWAPNAKLQQAVYDLYTDTMGNLYQLSFGARQERIVEVSQDSNLILLTHKYMGLDADDRNMETFRTINNIRNDEVLKIRKGRKIKYFI